MTHWKNYLTLGDVFVLVEDERISSPKGVSGQEGRVSDVAPLPFPSESLSCKYTQGQFPWNPWTETDLPFLPLLYKDKSKIN